MQKKRKKSRWRWLLPLGLLALVATAAIWYFFSGDKQTGTMTAAVARGNIETTVLASGEIEANNLVSVGAQVSGQLQSLKVELGDKVKAGQLVAEIDSLPQQNTLQTKKAALQAIQAEKKAKEASLALAELTFNRQKKMLRGDAASREDYETAEANLKVLKAEIQTLDAEIEQARIAVDTAQIDLGYTKITSPIDGVVVAIVTKEGQTVNANQTAPTIIKVANLDRVTVKVEISEADVVKVKPGQRVYFTILGEPDNRIPAILNSIEPAPESISSDSSSSSSSSSSSTSSSSSSTAIYYMGVLDVPNPDGKLRISMTTQVNIVLAEAQNALVIPSAALGNRDRQGRYSVQVAEGPEQTRQQWVKIGLNNNVQAEILEGLSEGQQVVIGDKATAATTSSSGMRRRGPPPGML
nr:efflux RND transporter periplasmic adaptor subunit [uncultured Desulfobulbus sp.]